MVLLDPWPMVDKTGVLDLGQWSATRSDLFPNDVREVFSRLQNHVRPHSYHATRATIKAELGAEIEEIFEEFDGVPIGVGAIAQVYRAKLRGQPNNHNPAAKIMYPTPGVELKEQSSNYVAVKVLHPNVETEVYIDLLLLKWASQTISRISALRWVSLSDEAQTFSKMMIDQLDLAREARHLAQFRREFKKWRYITFPTPYRVRLSQDGHVECSVLEEDGVIETHRVLVEEHIDGSPLSKFLKCAPSTYDEELARLGLESFLEMLLINNHIHSDMHPGNILVTFVPTNVVENTIDKIQSAAIQLPRSHSRQTDDQTDDIQCTEFRAALAAMEGHYRPRLVLLDVGLSTTLSPVRRRDLIDLLRAIAEFRGRDAGHLMVERSRDPTTVIDQEGFAAKIDKIVLSVKKDTLALGRVGFGQILSDVLSSVRQHRVRLEGDFANIVVAIIVVEGIGRQLDDELDLLAATVPVLSRLDSQTKGEFRHIVGQGMLLHVARFLWGWTSGVDVTEYESYRILFPYPDP
ncbi:hypothetical protein SmJEL517_g05028 [Synchytrium microbalum]|uniref:ABC1 atypical kinase-like domain-containing protein n=1 Tax=Synchytrium microbalum TaxID=1806994 RepID=A0A507C183_9FUNG|nr:uncharacterized protein SmJEL517_g05028 [Synchytrium microbalum]TPX31746.1 hypothetical protein SmJEL517_g05028 [Synchytrium microbalum]